MCSSGKIGYPTKRKAHVWAGRLGKHFGHRFFAYKCSECERWHLTKQNPAVGRWLKRCINAQTQ